MPRLSTLSNPTGLIELDKSRISVLIDEANDLRACSLAALDVSNLSLPHGLHVILIGSRGNSEERIDLGPLTNWNRSFVRLAEIGDDGPWMFRVLLIHPGESKLVAAAEGVRPSGQDDADSFIALEPAELGQLPWEVYVLEQEGRAVIRFNKEIYLSSGEASSDASFIALVLPEAIRRVAEQVCKEPSCLEDESWSAFRLWLMLHGIEDEIDEDSTEEEKSEWCGAVVKAFCDRFEFANSLKSMRTSGGDE